MLGKCYVKTHSKNARVNDLNFTNIWFFWLRWLNVDENLKKKVWILNLLFVIRQKICTNTLSRFNPITKTILHISLRRQTYSFIFIWSNHTSIFTSRLGRWKLFLFRGRGDEWNKLLTPFFCPKVWINCFWRTKRFSKNQNKHYLHGDLMGVNVIKLWGFLVVAAMLVFVFV